MGKSELSSVQSSPKNELSSFSFIFHSFLVHFFYDENFKKHLMRKENMNFDPKLFEKNSEYILNNKSYDFQKNVLF